MGPITESTALRLAEALERVAAALEGGKGASFIPPEPSEREYVARMIVGGWQAAKAENARNRKKNSRKTR
jgi:hypothetical protein